MIHLSKILLGSDDINSVVSVLKSGQLVQGKKVQELESLFADLCGTKYAVAVNSGTAALHCALYALNIQSGDEVITTPFTFVATANSIRMMGAKPIFVDIDEKTFNINPNKIAQAISKKTKAIIIVNLFGQPADYDKIHKIAKQYKIKVIEDAAQSINASYKNKKSGNLADIGCFSFYATKNVMSGEGGIATTNSKEYSDKMRLYRQHGQLPEKKYEYYDLGFNYRMMDMIAALAISQLKKVNKITRRRQKIAQMYDLAFQQIKDIEIPKIESNRSHVYHQYVIRIRQSSEISRTALRKLLENDGIETAIHYPKPLYEFRHLGDHNNKLNNFPVTDRLKDEVLSIPINPLLTDQEIRHIIRSILRIYGQT